MKSVWLLVGLCLAAWGLTAYPAWLLNPELGLAHTATALVLCLVPAVGALLWIKHSGRGAPEFQVVALLGGSGVRLGVVLGLGLVLYWSFPDVYNNAFLFWLAGFYFFTLILELVLTLRAVQAKTS